MDAKQVRYIHEKERGICTMCQSREDENALHRVHFPARNVRLEDAFLLCRKCEVYAMRYRIKIAVFIRRYLRGGNS